MKYLLIVVCLVLGTAQAQRKTKFCPRARGSNDQCLSKVNSYKCGVFFKDISPKLPLQWLGALPDAIAKVGQDPDAIKEILGDVTKESFNDIVCGSTLANARCYTALSKIIAKPLDTCDRNALATKAEDTVGNFLCAQRNRWTKGEDSIAQVTFQYSECGQPWAPITVNGSGTPTAITTSEELCCKGAKFVRCPDSKYKDLKFNSECN